LDYILPFKAAEFEKVERERLEQEKLEREKLAKRKAELLESTANFWLKLAVSEEEAIKLTQDSFKLIRQRKIQENTKAVDNLKLKLLEKKDEILALEHQIKQIQDNLELTET
jgi:hypothetical protein